MEIPQSDTVFVIGNGLSREGFDWSTIKGHGHIIGCNWFYRDGIADTITMIDTPPQHKVCEEFGKDTPFNRLTQSISRRHVLFNGETVVMRGRDTGPWYNNSGVYSTWFACKYMGAKRIYFIGVDFFRPTDRIIQDDYIRPHDNKNVKGSPTNDIYGINTIGRGIHKCFNQLLNIFKDVEFIRIGPVADTDREFYDTQIHPRLILKDSYDN